MENNLKCFELRNVRDFYLLLFQETWCNHILVHSWQIFHKWASTLSLKTERRYFAGHTKWYTRLLTLWHKATYVLDSFCIALPFDDILSPKGRPYVASNGENPKEALTRQRHVTRLFYTITFPKQSLLPSSTRFKSASSASNCLEILLFNSISFSIR